MNSQGEISPSKNPKVKVGEKEKETKSGTGAEGPRKRLREILGDQRFGHLSPAQIFVFFVRNCQAYFPDGIHHKRLAAGAYEIGKGEGRGG